MEPDPVPPPREPGPIEMATIGELRARKRFASVKGQIAVRLARELDDPALSGSQLSTLGGRLESILEAALAGAPPAPDELDEITQRIEEKRARASGVVGL